MTPIKYILLITYTFLFSAFLDQIHGQSQAIERYLSSSFDKWNIPGMAVGIVHEDQILVARGFGTTNLENPSPVDENTIFAIASNTKAFIATAIGMLVEEGLLHWEDPVIKHLPYFKLYNDYVTQRTTVRDLLCHRVGLGTFSGDLIWYRRQWEPAVLLQHIHVLEPAYEFRSGYGYSNLMFIAAGEVIKAVSGLSWDQYLKEKIFRPLGMNRTVTSTSVLPNMANVAQPHKPEGTNRHEVIPFVNWDNMGAAGGILSSVSDMLKWIQLQINGGEFENQYIFSSTLQAQTWRMHNSYPISPQAKEQFPTRHFNGYGLGWNVFDYGGRFVATHSGGYDGMYSRVVIVPEERLGVVILTNSMKGNHNAIMYQLLDDFLGLPSHPWDDMGVSQFENAQNQIAAFVNQKEEWRTPNTEPDVPIHLFSGNYRCPFYGDIGVDMEKGNLHLHFEGAPELSATLSHWQHNTYKINWNQPQAWFDWGTLQFILNNDGYPYRLEFDVPNNDFFFNEINAVRVPGE